MSQVSSSHENCLICDRITAIRKGNNPFFVAERETGYVVLGDYQFFHGYTLFLCKVHALDLHELEPTFRIKFLSEMAEVAEAVYRAFRPVHLNYELLCNSEPHLHWHLFPRHTDDPAPNKPVWTIDRTLRYSDATRPDAEALEKMKLLLREHLLPLPSP